MEIYLSTLDKKDIIRLPVVEAEKVSFSNSLNTETFENSLGKELTLIGEEKLRTITINSFFPHKKYKFMNFASDLAPECLAYLTKHRKEVLDITVILATTSFAYPCIIKDFKYKQKQNRDIDYSLTIEEYQNR